MPNKKIAFSSNFSRFSVVSRHIYTFLHHNLRNLLLLFLIILFITLPFLDKPYHIDDSLFIYMARAVNKNILLPYNFHFSAEDRIRPGFEGFTNPPLNSYFIAAIIRFFGENPIVLHSFFILSALFTAFSLYLLSKLFVKNPFLVTCLMLTTPVFMIQSHSLMPDIMLLGLWCQAIYFYIKGLDKNNTKLILLSSLFTSLALFTRYNGLLIMPLLFIYTLLKKNKLRPFFLYLLIPLGAFIIWCLHNIIFYGKPHILTPVIISQSYYMKSANILPRVILYFIYIGSLMIFPVYFIIIFLLKEKYSKKKYLSAILVLFLFCFCYLVFRDNLLINVIFYSITTSLCILFFIWLIKSLQKFKNNNGGFYKYVDDLFLFAWIIILISFHSSAYFLAPKFITLLIPAVAFLLFRLLERKYVNFIAYSKGIILICFTLGFILCESDYFQASVDSKKYSQIIKDYAQKVNKKIWVTNVDSNWGFYTPRELDAVYSGHDFKKGDLILGTPSIYKKNLWNKGWVAVPKNFLYLKPPLFVVYDPINNIHLYWDGHGEYLPYSISTKELSTAIIWEIAPKPKVSASRNRKKRLKTFRIFNKILRL